MNLRGMAQGLLGFLPRLKWLSLALRQLRLAQICLPTPPKRTGYTLDLISLIRAHTQEMSKLERAAVVGESDTGVF